MKYIKGSYMNHSKVYNIIFIGISLSITLGLVLALSIDKNLSNNIYSYFIDHINNYNLNKLSNILYPIIIYFIIFIISLTIIGSFMPFLTLFIENISIGLILGISLRNNGLNGLLFRIIYFTITKLLYILLLIYLTINIYKFIKKIINLIKTKETDNIYNLYSKIIYKTLFCIGLITIYNIINIFIAPKLIRFFIFLI